MWLTSPEPVCTEERTYAIRKTHYPSFTKLHVRNNLNTEVTKLNSCGLL